MAIYHQFRPHTAASKRLCPQLGLNLSSRLGRHVGARVTRYTPSFCNMSAYSRIAVTAHESAAAIASKASPSNILSIRRPFSRASRFEISLSRLRNYAGELRQMQPHAWPLFCSPSGIRFYCFYVARIRVSAARFEDDRFRARSPPLGNGSKSQRLPISC